MIHQTRPSVIRKPGQVGYGVRTRSQRKKDEEEAQLLSAMQQASLPETTIPPSSSKKSMATTSQSVDDASSIDRSIDLPVHVRAEPSIPSADASSSLTNPSMEVDDDDDPQLERSEASSISRKSLGTSKNSEKDNGEKKEIPLIDLTVEPEREIEEQQEQERQDTTHDAQRESSSIMQFHVEERSCKIFKNKAGTSMNLVPSHQSLDYTTAMNELRQKMKEVIQTERSTQQSDLKVHSAVKIKYVVEREGVIVDEPAFFFTAKSVPILRHEDVDVALQPIIERLSNQIEDQQERGSDFKYSSMEHACLSMSKYVPIKGGSFVPLPLPLAKKGAVLNIQTRDQKCLLDCIAAALHPWPSRHPERPQRYARYRDEIKTGNLVFPLRVEDMQKIESMNKNLALNVYGFQNCSPRSQKYSAGYTFFPLRISDNRHANVKVINLLLIEDPLSFQTHFALIKDLAKLTNRANSYHHGKSHVCDWCLCHFTKEDLLTQHKEICSNFKPVAVSLPKEGANKLQFSDFAKSHQHPFVIFMDFESREVCSQDVPAATSLESPLPAGTPRKYSWIKFPSEVSHCRACTICREIKPCDRIRQSKQLLSRLDTFSYCYQIHSTSATDSFPLQMCQKKNIGEKLLCSLKQDMHELYLRLRENVPMRMSAEDERNFENSVECYICHQPFKSRRDRCRDHSHIDGQYRGAACGRCNLQVNAKVERERERERMNDAYLDYHFLKSHSVHTLILTRAVVFAYRQRIYT